MLSHCISLFAQNLHVRTDAQRKPPTLGN